MSAAAPPVDAPVEVKGGPPVADRFGLIKGQLATFHQVPGDCFSVRLIGGEYGQDAIDLLGVEQAAIRQVLEKVVFRQFVRHCGCLSSASHRQLDRLVIN